MSVRGHGGWVKGDGNAVLELCGPTFVPHPAHPLDFSLLRGGNSSRRGARRPPSGHLGVEGKAADVSTAPSYALFCLCHPSIHPTRRKILSPFGTPSTSPPGARLNFIRFPIPPTHPPTHLPSPSPAHTGGDRKEWRKSRQNGTRAGACPPPSRKCTTPSRKSTRAFSPRPFAR